jgi:uncharacterized protein YcaQ
VPDPSIAAAMPTTSLERISLREARRVALAAQGFSGAQRTPPTTLRAIDKVLEHTQVLQIDSVNIVARAQYVPIYSRLGPYPRDLLDRASTGTPRRPARVFEFWAHEASYLPVELQPLLRWRMAAAHDHAWGSVVRVARENPGLVERVREQIAALGPMTARQLSPTTTAGPKTNWGWNWNEVKVACEWLFYTGEITSAGRTSSFERRYDLPERVLPAHVLATPTPSTADAIRGLVERSARAHGIGTIGDLSDYFRLGVAQTRAAVLDLVEAGTLAQVQVEGWTKPTYLHVDARRPARVQASALLSPFDPLIWERTRAEALFDFFYRIEIYTPAHKRVHGYYVLPFLLGDRLVARVDLKADRAAGVLRVLAAHRERGAPAQTAEALAVELRRMAGWLGCDDVQVLPLGDLAGELATRVGG